MIRLSYREPISSIQRGHKGWIDPDGDVLPLNSEFDMHGKWFIRNYRKLKSRHKDLPNLSELEGKSYDSFRDLLIDRGWIHIYNSSAITVYKLDEHTKHILVDAILMGQFLPNYPLHIFEKVTDRTYTLREEELARHGIDAFAID
jgi:hypothetical protein